MSENPTDPTPTAAMPALVLPFDAITAADLARVGGKGANLGELARAGFPVPAGFAVTTRAFRDFIAICAEMPALYDALDALAPGDVAGARVLGARVRATLADVPMPAPIAEAVTTAWRGVGETHAYAVRSSATAEDLPGASFAGQQDTFLNVRGAAALLDAVKACWVSLFTDRAILYRAQNGFGHRHVLLSVVVQRMVQSDVSGILFTADPVTGHRGHSVVEAGFGLGEALVGGLITADRFRIDTASGTILERAISDKGLAIRPSADGGTVTVPLEGSARTAPALTDDEARQLAALGARIAAHYGQPQDIEWAMEHGAVYIVQSRPITTLFPLPVPLPTDGALHVYLSFGHVQVMTAPMPPLSLSTWPYILPLGRRAEGTNVHMRTAAGRLYFDPTALLHREPLQRGLPLFLDQADRDMAAGVRQVMARPEFLARAGQADGQIRRLSLARFMIQILCGVVVWLVFRRPEGAAAWWTARLDGYLADTRQRVAATPAGAERLVAACIAAGDGFAHVFPQFPPTLAAGVLARVLLARLTRGRADPADLDALVRGLNGNVTTEMDMAVGDLADQARAYPAVVTAIESPEPVAALAALGDAAGGAEFRVAWTAFLDRYGDRGPSEIDVSRPRYRDDPTPLLRVIAGSLVQDEPGVHRSYHARLVAEGEAAAARLIAASRHGVFGPLRAPVAGRLTRVARNLLAIREHPKYFLVRILALIRASALDVGARLVAAGRLDAVDDVWFLTVNEAVAALGTDTADLRPRIAERREALARYQHVAPPRVITSDGEIPLVSAYNADLPPGALAGTAASPGVVEGIARVVLDPGAEVLRPGEILVAPFTDPGWTPLFINAAGLVMEVGGLMTHGSVVAREYGIPAVVGVSGATTRIQTGARLRIDGAAGVVVILSPPSGDGASADVA